MDDYNEFQNEYHDLTLDVTRSGYKSYALKLRDWIRFLDDSGYSKVRIAQLENGFDFSSWYTQAKTTHSGMAGSGTLDWDEDRTKRLGQHMGLFRHLASKADAYSGFGQAFLYAGGDLDNQVAKINAELFDSFARELLKDLRKFNTNQTYIPAADRDVSLDHNSAGYAELIENIAATAKSLKENNQLGEGEPEIREQVIAEMSAGKRLLEASKLRVNAFLNLIIPPLRWICEKAAGSVVGKLALGVLGLIAAFFGISIPGL